MKPCWLAAAMVLSAAPVALAAPPLAPTAGSAIIATEAPRLGSWGFDLAGRDTRVNAGDDFYRYANGTYVANLVIPPDLSRYGAFQSLIELSQARMRAVLEAAAADRSAGGERAKVGAFYRSFMDEALVNRLGARPL